MRKKGKQANRRWEAMRLGGQEAKRLKGRCKTRLRDKGKKSNSQILESLESFSLIIEPFTIFL
jgi:hypothetical protein